jgi:hypothetical protein
MHVFRLRRTHRLEADPRTDLRLGSQFRQVIAGGSVVATPGALSVSESCRDPGSAQAGHRCSRLAQEVLTLNAVSVGRRLSKRRLDFNEASSSLNGQFTSNDPPDGPWRNRRLGDALLRASRLRVFKAMPLFRQSRTSPCEPSLITPTRF